MDFTVPQIAQLLHVSKSTIEKRMREWNLSIRQQYATLPETELDDIIRQLLTVQPNLGLHKYVDYSIPFKTCIIINPI